MQFTVAILLFCSISSVQVLLCYFGLTYMVGQEERQDVEECVSFLGLTDEYCYRFMDETAVQEGTKVGCASVIFAPIGNDCGPVEFGGVTGTIFR
ncbi:hypothetical protein L596_005192 [Steinernema carpocapsae]|uniref:Saposin B-type domain-containing protein n=1 Tax=Steinernema carpocapsae TaxID=34508 RepID=A0A4V6YSY5_STECR|nr:hypothetical protein L596_005192 [Steinernema carpocapsae]